MKDCLSSTISAFQNLCRDRFWQQILWSEVRALDLLGRALRLLEQLSACKTMHTRIWLRKKQQLSTSPSNHVIALGSSIYRFPWFRQHFSTYDLSSKGFCINLLGFLLICLKKEGTKHREHNKHKLQRPRGSNMKNPKRFTKGSTLVFPFNMGLPSEGLTCSRQKGLQ